MAKRKSVSKSKSKGSTKSRAGKKSTSTKAKSSSRRTKTSSKKTSAGQREVTIDRRRKPGRRKEDGRGTAEKKKTKAPPKLERRKKVNRRRQIDPTTCERDYTDDEIQFMSALDDYKRASGRMFPTCSEVLEVVRSLGYVRLSAAELTARQEVTAAPEQPASTATENPSAQDQNDESHTDWELAY